MKQKQRTRRNFLLGSALAASPSLAQQPSAAPAAERAPSPQEVKKLLDFTDLDETIWREELQGFVPSRICDMHNHLTRYEFDLGRNKAEDWRWKLPSAVFRKNGSLELLDNCDAAFYPGRAMTHLMTANPHPVCDIAASNAFIAQQASKAPDRAYALMIVHPKMTSAEVDRLIRRHRFLGFKPYRWYSTTGDMENCRIPDFMPEHQLDVANRYGLMVLLHVSRKRAIADAHNLEDLTRLSRKFPRVKWQLAHGARSYSNWAIDVAAPTLRSIPNLWYDTSSVCESDAFHALFTSLNPARVCYGSDDFAVGITHGKYVTYGYSWGEMNVLNQTLNRTHCDGRFTFVRYEMLRAMRRGAMYARLSRPQIEAVFHENGRGLIDAVLRDMNQTLGPTKPEGK